MGLFSRLFRSRTDASPTGGANTTPSTDSANYSIEILISDVKICPEADVSIIAALRLANYLGFTKAFDVMVESLESERDIEKRHAIIYALRYIVNRCLKEESKTLQDPLEHAKLLLPYLTEKKYQARCDIARILGMIANPVAIDPLLSILRSDDGISLRQAAAFALRDIGTEEAINALKVVLTEDDELKKMGLAPELFPASRNVSPLTETDKTPATTRWYFAIDQSRGLRQIVFLIGDKPPTESRFANLVMKPDKYATLLGQIAVGFFRTDNDPGPFLMIKTPNFAEAMAKEPVSIAFNFCHMPTGPVFAIFIHSPSTKEKFKSQGGCFIEQAYSMDSASGFDDLITDAFKHDELVVVFAQVGGMTGTLCLFDVKYTIDGSLKEKFADEWSKLVAHGNKVGHWGAPGTFAASRDELYARLPVAECPILPRSNRTL